MEVLGDIKNVNIRKFAFIIIAGCSLEMYDFVAYSFFAVGIAQLFFPEKIFFDSLLLSYATFAIGYFTRPIGSILFGYLSDTKGRKVGLIYSVLCMGVPISIIGLLPTYQTIGILAPILLLICRTAQGLSLGGEVPSAITFFSEYSSHRNRAFVTSWIFYGLNLGIILASLVGTLIVTIFSHATVMAGAWRILFLLGGLISWIVYYMRKNLYETPQFMQLKQRHLLNIQPLFQLFKTRKIDIIKGFFLLSIIMAASGTLFLFMPIYLFTYLKINTSLAFAFNTINILVLTMFIPIAATLADKFGRKPIFILGILFLIINTYPLFLLLNNTNPLLILWALIALGIPAAFVFGPIAAMLAELFSTNIRTTAIGVIYNINCAIFLGLNPLTLIFLIKYTNNLQSPALYLIVSGLISLIAVLTLKESRGQSLSSL